MGILANQLGRTETIGQEIRSEIKKPLLKKVGKGLLDISRNVYEGTENLSADIINEGLDLFGKQPIKPLREQLIPTGEEYKGGLLKRSVDTIQKRGVELGEINTETVEGNQTSVEGVFQGVAKIGRGILDIAGDSFITGLSTLTPDEQKQQLKNIIQEVSNTEGGGKAIETAQILQEKYKKFKQENPRAGRNTDAIGTYLEGAIELIGFGLANKGIKSTQKTGQELTEKLLKNIPGNIKNIPGNIKNIPGNIKNIPGKIDNKIQETGEKLLIKMQNNAMKKNQLQAEEATSRILQGETKDIIPALKTFNKIDLKDVNDYKGLGDKVNTNLKNIVETQDELLKAKGTILNIENATKTINTSKGKITTNPIKNAIDDIDRVILDTGEDLYALKFGDDTIGDITSRIKNGQGTIKDYNDLARFYNSEFKSKIYTKKGDAKDSIIADRYENNRIGIKNFVRDNLGDDILKQLDLDYSNAAKTKQLIEKAIEGVNKLEQKIKQGGLGEKTGRLVARAIDISSMGTIRGFLTGFLPSNIGNKVNNWLDIQGELRKNIKLLQKATNQPTKSNLQKVDEFLGKIAGIKPKEGKFYVKKEQFKPKGLLPQKAGQGNKKPIILPLSDRQIIQESKKGLKPKQQPQINRELQDNKTITKSKKIKPEGKEGLKSKENLNRIEMYKNRLESFAERLFRGDKSGRGGNNTSKQDLIQYIKDFGNDNNFIKAKNQTIEETYSDFIGKDIEFKNIPNKLKVYRSGNTDGINSYSFDKIIADRFGEAKEYIVDKNDIVLGQTQPGMGYQEFEIFIDGGKIKSNKTIVNKKETSSDRVSRLIQEAKDRDDKNNIKVYFGGKEGGITGISKSKGIIDVSLDKGYSEQYKIKHGIKNKSKGQLYEGTLNENSNDIFNISKISKIKNKDFKEMLIQITDNGKKEIDWKFIGVNEKLGQKIKEGFKKEGFKAFKKQEREGISSYSILDESLLKKINLK